MVIQSKESRYQEAEVGAGDVPRRAIFSRSSHRRLPIRVSKCGETLPSCPAVIIVLRILLRYASTNPLSVTFFSLLDEGLTRTLQEEVTASKCSTLTPAHAVAKIIERFLLLMFAARNAGY